MDPSGRFVHGSMAAGKPCPKDARYFMNFINFKSWKAQLYEPGKKRFDAFAVVFLSGLFRFFE